MESSLNNEIGQIRDLKKEQFEILYQISRTLNSVVYEDALIEKTLDLVITLIDAERGLFAKYDAGNGSFSIIAARNVNKENISDLSSFSSGILKQVIESKKPCLYHDVQSDPNISQFQSIQIQRIKSVIGVPINYNNEIWGVILADSQGNRREFTAEKLYFLDFFSNLVSLALNKIVEMDTLKKENLLLKNQIEVKKSVPNIIGESPVMKSLSAVIHKVAKTDATVLILGESGTGKDLIAQAIHKLSGRKEKPYLAQFCGSIPDTLLESELFGYKKGAFSGANTDKKGLLEAADGGTFFLDEIADIPMALQVKLLRVLENREIISLGDTNTKKIDVRVIAATNQDLKALSREGKFREDLFYRLNVFPITIPPLRQRKGDISLLAKYFVKKHSENEIKIMPETLKKLEKFSWPGNVRQLENVLQRAVIMCSDKVLRAEHVILDDEQTLDEFRGTLKDLEGRLLMERLKEYRGNKTFAAKSLGVSVRWVQLKLKEMNVDEWGS